MRKENRKLLYAFVFGVLISHEDDVSIMMRIIDALREGE